MSGACEPLKNWNLHDDLDSRGAILFRRFASQVFDDFTGVPTGLQGGMLLGMETVFTTPFSVERRGPHAERAEHGQPARAGRAGGRRLRSRGRGIPLDAPLGQHQYEVRGGRKIPIHGGPGGVGVFNAINVSWDPEEDGYGNVPHGSSFVMAAQFVAGRCPVEAGTFVTYGQSENQRSKHAADYTRAFSQKQWNRVPFCQREVRRQTLSTKTVSVR